jgi:DNA-binding protein HU-beta
VWLHVTVNPTAEKISQQLTEAREGEIAPGHIVRDRDCAYGKPFVRRVRQQLSACYSRQIFVIQRSLCGQEGTRFMNKADFVHAIAEKTGITQADAGKSVDAAIAVISEALAKGDDVKLLGFGTFQVVDRAATEGRNPRTGEKIAIAASRQPKFKAGVELKRAVGGNG